MASEQSPESSLDYEFDEDHEQDYEVDHHQRNDISFRETEVISERKWNDEEQESLVAGQSKRKDGKEDVFGKTTNIDPKESTDCETCNKSSHEDLVKKPQNCLKSGNEGEEKMEVECKDDFPFWWSQMATPPVLVEFKSGGSYDIDISHVRGLHNASYWALPFVPTPGRNVIKDYKKFIMKDEDRLRHVPSLSGLRLGCVLASRSHGNVLIKLFEELHITKTEVDVYWLNRVGPLPTLLRVDDLDRISSELAQRRLRRWNQGKSQKRKRSPKNAKRRQNHAEKRH